MTRAHSSGLILAAGLLIVLGLHFFDGVEKPASDADNDLVRKQLVNYYLTLKEADEPHEEKMKKALDRQSSAAGEDEALCEVVALLYWLDGEESRARKLIKQLPDKQALRPLRYSFNLVNTLPEGWENDLADDWVGARIAAIVYKKMGKEAELANTLIRLRYFENMHSRAFGIGSWLWLLSLVGMGLLISMWFSVRQWARLGENFFKLKALQIPLPITLRFVGFFFLSFIGIGAVLNVLFPEDNRFYQQFVGYPLQVICGLLLIRFYVFAGNRDAIIDALGLRNLNMRFMSLFQIVGGVAILFFLIELGTLAAYRWPADPNDFGAEVSEIFQTPLLAAWFLIVTCLVAPVCEEIIFRGLVFRGLMAHMKSGTAAWLSAFFFCVVHPLPHWPNIFLVGAGLALIYNRTANLLVNIWVHAIVNLIIIFATLFSYF